jgi:peptide/nickel transport system substrate-binding protein
MRRRTRLSVVISVLLAVFLLPSVATEGQTPKHGGVLTVGSFGPYGHLDPHGTPNQTELWLIQLVYSYLVRYDQNLNLRPDLTTSWERPDPKTYVFHLRHGVRFHNGRELTSADVKYSVLRIMDPKTGSSRRLRYDSVDQVETPDPYTVVFRLKYPDNVLPYVLADPASAIVAKEIVEQPGALQTMDAGSGPFKLERLGSDSSASVVRNPDYYERGKPYLDRIALPYIPDNSARITALRTGDIDMATFLVTNQIQVLQRDTSVVVTDGRSGQFYFLALNIREKPFDDANVRRAIAWAIDRDALVKGALAGEGYPLDAGPIPPWHWAGLKTPIFHHDPARAKQLLAASEAPSGFTFTIRVWAPQDYVVDTASLIQQQLQPLGIKIQIMQQADFTTYFAPVLKGDYQATIQGYSGNVHPDDWLYERFRTGGATNITRYSNSTVDDLLQRARVAPAQDREATLYSQVQQIIAQDVAMVFLYNMRQAEAHRTYVKGFVHLPTLTLAGLTTTWLDR